MNVMTGFAFHAPAAAYRLDVGDRQAPFGANDDAWLSAAIELHHSVRARGKARKEHLYSAIGTAIDVLGDAKVESFVDREWRGQRSYCTPVIILADAVHYDGALRLAAGMLDDVRTAAPDLTAIEHGRLLGMRARIAWKLDRMDEASERYDYIDSVGKKYREVELEAIAQMGHATLAQLRGHFPELRQRTVGLLALAERTHNRAILRAAYNASMIAGNKSSDASSALIAGWRAWELSRDHEPWEAESLVNLAQVMLDSGHPSRARAGFAAALERNAPTGMLLAALGGLALASAMTGQEATVEWTIREVSRAHTLPVAQYALGLAELECAQALVRLGRVDEAERHRRAAEDISKRNRFSEVSFKAAELDTLSRPRKTTPLAEEAEAYALRLEALEPERLPSHVQFGSVPA